MATIRIADDPHPKDDISLTKPQDGDSSSLGHGIYNTRSFSRSNTADTHDDIYNIRSQSKPPSANRRSRSGNRRVSTAGQEDDDPGLRKPGDFKQKQVFRGKMLLWLAYQSIGVIYGDIGTSPLYVYSSTFSSAPSRQDLIGALSIIIWSLFMMVTVKYVFVILRADNEGEGGTFSTYSLLSRYMNITNRDPREASLVQMKRYLSGDLERSGQHVRRGLESSKVARGLLKVMGVLAVTMVISDGLLTPAQSVLGAVQGIEVVQPNISKGTVIGVTDAILVLLFAVQPLGITNITFAFAPIVIIWLGFNAAFGIYNLVNYDSGVFKAFNPGQGFEFLIRNGEHGWRMLGGILLAFTGVEALFADLGAFSRQAIQLSWLCYTFPCLLLAYIGQAAYISVHPEAYSNPFFKSAPPGTIYPALVIAILAAIVASQAIITATFQLLAQVMKLSYFPQIKVVHTSNIFHGQLYIPAANWLLMVGTILVASIYNNTTSLGNAYGVCVMFVTTFDTCMVSMAAMFVWRINPFIVFLPWLTIACLDGAYLSSALTKVPSGAWFTIALATVLAFILLLWRFGKEQQWSAEAEDRFPTSHFVTTDRHGQIRLTDRFDSASLSTTGGFGIFFDKAGETTPIVFSQFVLKLTAMPEVIVFFHLRPLEAPSVAPENRHTVSRLAIPNCYRLVVRYGYNDEIITPNLASVIMEQIRRYLMENNFSLQRKASLDLAKTTTDENHAKPTHHITTTSIAEKKPVSEAQFDSELAILEKAYAHKVLYIMGKEQMKIKEGTNYARRALLWIFLWIRENTRNKMANLRVPTDKVIEVGFLKEI
ncbi:potassium transporter-domain-containing protein [Bisporella sp. PMI_857]|nr:potassium transporter-domain-containing protein [Bisporella sp. PMI_857]